MERNMRQMMERNMSGAETSLTSLPTVCLEAVVHKFLDSNPTVQDICSFSSTCREIRTLTLSGPFQHGLKIEFRPEKLQDRDDVILKFLERLDDAGVDYASLLLGTYRFFMEGSLDGLTLLCGVAIASPTRHADQARQAQYNFAIAVLLKGCNRGVQCLRSVWARIGGRFAMINCRNRLRSMIGADQFSKITMPFICSEIGRTHWSSKTLAPLDCYFDELKVTCDKCIADIEMYKLALPELNVLVEIDYSTCSSDSVGAYKTEVVVSDDDESDDDKSGSSR